MTEVEELLQVALHAAQAAARVVAARYDTHDTASSTKGDGTMVTETDTASNAVLQEHLGTTGIPILSEEQLIDTTAVDRLWVVDPLDGTMDFVQRTGDFSVMVALVEQGSPVLGVVAIPTLDACLVAQRGAGAWRVSANGERTQLHVSGEEDPARLRMLVSRNHPAPLSEQVQQTLGIPHTVPAGSVGVKLGLIAQGDAELFINPTGKMGWWDIAAPQVILEEAGGVVSDIRGEPIRYRGADPHVPYGVCAANGATLYARVRRAIASY